MSLAEPKPAPPPSPKALTPPAVDQAAVFARLRMRLLVNASRDLLRQAKGRVITMTVCSLVIWANMYWVTEWGFGQLQSRQIPAAGAIVGVLFDMMFFALGGMLIFSAGVILYASLFTNPEARFLLTTPADPDQIFASKLQSAIAFASWGFIVLGSPVLLSYGVVYSVTWMFFALLPLFFLGFIILPGAVGGMLGLLLVNFFPNRRKQAFAAVAVLLALAGGVWSYRTVVIARESMEGQDALQSLIDQFALAQSAWSPSHWTSRGLLAAARGDFLNAGYGLALLWSNALLGYLAVTWAARRLYRRGFDRMSSGGFARRAYRETWMDRGMGFLVGYLDPQTRLLIAKDFKTFRRDPTQWVQIGIFVGLLGLLGANFRFFYRTDVGEGFRSFLSIVNVGAVCLLMCTLLVRFIYPQISLEGRKFWILGLLPMRRDKLLWGKFVFAYTTAGLLGTFMAALSDLALGMPALVIPLHAFTVLTVAAGLSGLSVGISAWMPNFRETDPSKIVTGFGGTMNILLGLGYLIVAVTSIAGPYHLHLFKTSESGDAPIPPSAFAGIPIGLLATALTVGLPMRKGIKTLRRMEF